MIKSNVAFSHKAEQQYSIIRSNLIARYLSCAVKRKTTIKCASWDDSRDTLPPYSQLSSPVYSLSTCNAQGNRRTLNLVTYASPISLEPRHYALGLYRHTLSWQNMLETRQGVLQILGKHHAPLFHLLGKTSGRHVDKLHELARNGFNTTEYCNQHILDDCYGAMLLQVVSEPWSAGNHDVVLCSVLKWTSCHTMVEPLYTEYLREEGYLA